MAAAALAGEPVTHLFSLPQIVTLDCIVGHCEWWQKTTCMVCGADMSAKCDLCFGYVCSQHRMMGSSKPLGWPKLSGGMHVYCLDKNTCFRRWQRAQELMARSSY